jgi:hypothetical protein
MQTRTSPSAKICPKSPAGTRRLCARRELRGNRDADLSPAGCGHWAEVEIAEALVQVLDTGPYQTAVVYEYSPGDERW